MKKVLSGITFVIRCIVLVFAFILTVIMKVIILIGFIRLQFKMSEELDVDMGYIVTNSSRLLNQFWDITLNRHVKQPHHDPKDIFGAAFKGSLKTIEMLFASLFSWKR